MNIYFDLIRMLSKEPEKRLSASELFDEFSQVTDFLKKIIFIFN